MSADGVAILGGGLAGLSASLHCGAPVYEADDTPGGVALSDTVEGFTFDRGIHVLQTQNQAILELLQELGIEFRVIPRNAFIYSHGTYTPYPFQINTAGLPLGLRAQCVWHFLRRRRHGPPTNYEEWMCRNLGDGFARIFLIPYSEKFWTIHPREMTYEWAGSRVPQPSVRQVLRGAVWSKQTQIGANAVFRYPKNGQGYGAIADALRKRAGVLHLGHRAVAIDNNSRCVTFSNGVTVHYEVLINTIPLPDLVRLCPDAPDSVRVAASQLWTNSILLVNLGIGRPHISDRHWVHFPESDVPFFRISYPHNFGPELAPEGCSSLSAEVAFSPHRPLDRSTIAQNVIANLVRTKALGKHDPITVQTTREIKYAYCAYDKRRTAAARVVLQWLRSKNIVSCGRYGLWTYFWSDEAILSGKKAAEIARSGKSAACEEMPSGG